MAVAKDVRELGRRKLRYRLFRLSNGDPVEVDDGVAKYFESQEEFDGWHNFGVTWDVADQGEWPNGHWVAVSLTESLEDSWHRTVGDHAEDFDLAEDS